MVRHAESTKNLGDRFASVIDDDHLTAGGRQNATALAAYLSEFVSDVLCSRDVTVVCSDTVRATESAQIIASTLHARSMETNGSLNSIVVHETMGMTGEELRTFDANAARELNLYRAGLFDAYRMTYGRPAGRHYESQLEEFLAQLLSRVSSSTIILVAHRSAITALLLRAGRSCKYVTYPPRFFGYVVLDLGSVSLVRINEDDMLPIFANLQGDSLLTAGRSFVGVAQVARNGVD
jgi:broad specificity phosphatase PhoE